MPEPPPIADDRAAIAPERWLGRWISRYRQGRRRLVHLAEAVLLLGVMAGFASLPLDWASALGGSIGRGIGPWLGISRRALRNLTRAFPENGAFENRRILRGMWDNLGRSVAEYPHLIRICAADSGRVEIVNGQAVTRLLTDGRPGLVFSGHLGNWEVTASTIHKLMGSSLLSVYRAGNNPWFDRLLRRLRSPRLAVPKGAEGGRRLLGHMRGGGHVAMLVDQKQNDGIAVPFFGREAMTAPAIARLGLRFDCPIVPIHVERLQGARFRFTALSPLKIAYTGDPTTDVLATMTRVNAMIEGWVRARPEQWLWVHRRWAD